MISDAVSAAGGMDAVIYGRAFVGSGASLYSCPWCCGDLRGTDGESNLLVCVFCRHSVCAISGGAALSRCDDCTEEVAARRNMWSLVEAESALAVSASPRRQAAARPLDILAKSA